MGIGISRRLLVALCSSEAMSSVLSDFGMGSCRVLSAVPDVDPSASSWATGASSGAGEVVTKGGVG